MISLTSEQRTPYHRWPAWIKLVGLCIITVAMFYLANLGAAIVVTGAVVAAYLIGGGRFARQGLRMLRPLLWVVVIILGYHVVKGEAALGGIIVLRLISAIALANLVTMTTPLKEMLATVERGLARLSVPVRLRRRLALSVALVIRFIPVLVQKGGTLLEAWKARSRRRPSWRLIIPLALMAIDDAEHVAEALRARGGVS
ncbi:MAG: energy-coupling factor transporter transmembrane protein EcfT [Thalassovita sp.]